MDKKIAFIGEWNFREFLEVEVIKYNIYNLLPKTWTKKFEKIKQEIGNNQLDGIIIYLPTPLLMQITLPQYQNIWDEYLSTFTSCKVLLIVFEENLFGNFDYYDYEENIYYNLISNDC